MIADTLKRALVALQYPRPPRLPAPWRYLGAALAALLPFAVQYLLLPEPAIAPFVFFYFGVALAAWLGGRGPALLTVALSALTANYSFVAPYGAPALTGTALAATGLFVVASTAVALLCAAFRDAMLQAAAAAGNAHAAQERLRQQAELLEYAPVLVRDLDERVVLWNCGTEDLYGYSRHEALGRVAHELLQTRFPQPLEEIQSTLRREGRWEGELRHRRKDGEWLTVSSLWILHCDEADRPAAIIEIGADITARRYAEAALREALAEAEEGRRLLEAIMEHIPLGIAVAAAPDARVTHVSRYGRDLVGEAAPLAGVRLASGPAELRTLRHDGSRPGPAELPLSRAVLQGELVQGEELLVEREDGERIPVLCTAAPIRDRQGHITGGVVGWQDISGRQQMEQALREADRRKDEFLGVLSHELRNPLAPIRNSLYLLHRAQGLDERGRRATAVIDRQVNQLSRLVEDLLDVTRIARGKIRLQRGRIDLAELARRTAEDHQALFSASGLRFEVEVAPGPVWVEGDPARLAQVIGNLLSNAVKFTPTGGRVSLGLSAGEHARLEITDSGIGIDLETRARLFQPFAQADRTLERSRGGLGLGLALVKGLVELHDGEVEVHSDGPGRGARFSFHLPLLEREARASHPRRAAAPAPGGRGRRVLIVEDNRDAAESLREVLELSGHEVAVAFDGLEGVASARALRPEVVLCDIGLPGMDGYGVARQLRGDADLGQLYLVALTGYAQPEDRRRAREAGFDEHLAKPPNLEAIERLLSECCGGASAAESGAPLH